MNHAELIAWLTQQGADVIITPDRRRSISSHVARTNWNGVCHVACGADVDAKTQINAALDAVAWHIHDDRTDEVVRVVYGCAPDSEAVAALRILAAHISEPKIELIRLDGDTLVPDTAPAPVFTDSPDAKRWAPLLAGWRDAPVPAIAEQLAAVVDHPALRLYPMLTKKVGTWSLRLEGLEIGRLAGSTGWLDVGKTGKLGGVSTLRQRWVDVAGPQRIHYAADSTPGQASVADAASTIATFIESFDVAPEVALRKDEHALESRILRGATPVFIDGQQLELAFTDKLVSRGSQIPTKWALDTGKPRYLDGLLRSGEVPWAIEMKVDVGGGHGSYYRHAIGQAVLYRHFIRSAAPMHSWFSSLGLDATRCEAAVVFPETPPKVAERIARLKELASRFDVHVAEVS